MLCGGRIISCSSSPSYKSLIHLNSYHKFIDRSKLKAPTFRCQLSAAGAVPGDPKSPDASSSSVSSSSIEEISSGSSRDSDKNPASFCIIEGPETVQDFAKMELREIKDNIKSRRNKIFLHMEEVRRLRVQQRLKNAELGIFIEEQEDIPDFPSFIPFLPPLTTANLKLYYATCFTIVAGVIIFGGLLAPS
ncbi:Chaperone protein dnaJ-like, partial [Zostera marina]